MNMHKLWWAVPRAIAVTLVAALILSMFARALFPAWTDTHPPRPVSIGSVAVPVGVWGLSIALGVWEVRRTIRRKTADDLAPRCRRCGYSLRGLPNDRCPECGTKIEE